MPRRFRARMDAHARAGRFACVGLDPGFPLKPEQFPPGALRDCPDEVTQVDEQFRRIIAGVAGMPKMKKGRPAAFYPSLGAFLRHGNRGIDSLIRLIQLIRKRSPASLVILDMPTGDSARSAARSARGAFEMFDADAVTLNPYLGADAIEPFAEYKDKGVFVLCRGPSLYLPVARDMAVLNRRYSNIGLVVGASTAKNEMMRVREAAPRLPLLIPDYGEDATTLADIVLAARDAKGRGFLVSESRGYLAGWNADPEHSVQDGARSWLEAVNRCITATLAR